jgi:hypothetical protein
VTQAIEREVDVDPRIEHPDWCSIEHHEFTGHIDQWHREAPRVVDLDMGGGLEAWRVAVYVEQYLCRADDVWHGSAGQVALEVVGTNDDRADLAMTAHEARRVAAELLAAADVAEGVAR